MSEQITEDTELYIGMSFGCDENKYWRIDGIHEDTGTWLVSAFIQGKRRGSNIQWSGSNKTSFFTFPELSKEMSLYSKIERKIKRMRQRRLELGYRF